MNEQSFNLANNSYKRCNKSENFLNTFYDLFLQADERIAPLFANINMQRQKEMLNRSLYQMLVFAKDRKAGAYLIDRLKATHLKLTISADLYNIWLDCLIQAVKLNDKIFDNQFEPVLEADKVDPIEVEKAWREGMSEGISYIVGKDWQN